MINALYLICVLSGLLAIVAIARVRVYVLSHRLHGYSKQPVTYRAARTALVSSTLSVAAGLLVLAATRALAL